MSHIHQQLTPRRREKLVSAGKSLLQDAWGLTMVGGRPSFPSCAHATSWVAT